MCNNRFFSFYSCVTRFLTTGIEKKNNNNILLGVCNNFPSCSETLFETANVNRQAINQHCLMFSMRITHSAVGACVHVVAQYFIRVTHIIIVIIIYRLILKYMHRSMSNHWRYRRPTPCQQQKYYYYFVT